MTNDNSPAPGRPLSMGWAGLGATTTTVDPIVTGADAAATGDAGSGGVGDGVSTDAGTVCDAGSRAVDDGASTDAGTVGRGFAAAFAQLGHAYFRRTCFQTHI